jgi:hypothetical protein
MGQTARFQFLEWTGIFLFATMFRMALEAHPVETMLSPGTDREDFHSPLSGVLMRTALPSPLWCGAWAQE